MGKKLSKKTVVLVGKGYIVVEDENGNGETVRENIEGYKIGDVYKESKWLNNTSV